MDAITNNDWPDYLRYRVKYNSVDIIGNPVDVGTPTEPITLTEAKTHLQVDFSDNDTYITDLIKECRQLFERMTGVGIVSKTVTAAITNLRGHVSLPFAPVTSITSVVDKGGTAIISSNYDFYDSEYFRSPVSDYFKVVYVTTAMSPVPADIKRAIKRMVAFCYRNRNDESVDETAEMYKITQPFKIGSWLL